MIKQNVETIVGAVKCDVPVKILEFEKGSTIREIPKAVMITNTRNGLEVHCANYKDGKCLYNGVDASKAPSCTYGGLRGVRVSTSEARRYFKL